MSNMWEWDIGEPRRKRERPRFRIPGGEMDLSPPTVAASSFLPGVAATSSKSTDRDLLIFSKIQTTGQTLKGFDLCLEDNYYMPTKFRPRGRPSKRAEEERKRAESVERRADLSCLSSRSPSPRSLRTLKWSDIPSPVVEFENTQGSEFPNTSNVGLCSRCVCLDLERGIDCSESSISLRHNPLLEYLGQKRYRLHSYRTLQQACALCQIFLKIVEPHIGQAHRNYVGAPDIDIEVESPSWRGPFKLAHFRVPHLQIIIHVQLDHHEKIGHVFCQNNGSEILRHFKDDSLDYEMLYDCIQLCKASHYSVCNNVPLLSSEKFYPLKLIDCKLREVVLVAGRAFEPYATLSYVWGSVKHDSEHIAKLPSRLPATIEDAIMVTHRLGIRYLWIDRYCIDQRCKEEVQQQISLMGLIYQQSDVTIVAACGENPLYGLPGASRLRRKFVSPFTFRNNNFMEYRWRTKELIKESR
ncbi:heterokaryon incompatibility protein-domain-containing protein, partial [Bisporella sp. PMI_857]